MTDANEEQEGQQPKFSSKPIALDLGPDVIQLLLPHRAPFLLVDRVRSYRPGTQPLLVAERMISSGEPIFVGHFPNLHLWPGVYTIEGMGQSFALLATLISMHEEAKEMGRDPVSVLKGLSNLELGFQMHPGFRRDHKETKFVRELLERPTEHVKVSSAVDVKFLRPVFAGQRLEYEVQLTHLVPKSARFNVQARVGKVTVAKGTMTGSVLPWGG